MLIYSRNGKATVITGWRAWALGALMALGLLVAFYLVLFLMMGLAITAGVVLAVAIPVIAIGALLGSLFQSRRRLP